jgi:hypothetical protein
MKRKFSERNIVIVLFVMVLITFSLAQEDSRKMGKAFSGVQSYTAKQLLAIQAELKDLNKPSK